MSQWTSDPRLRRILQLIASTPDPFRVPYIGGTGNSLKSESLSRSRSVKQANPNGQRAVPSGHVGQMSSRPPVSNNFLRPILDMTHFLRPIVETIPRRYNHGYPKLFDDDHFTIENLPVRMDDRNPRADLYLRPNYLGFISSDWESRGGQQLVSSGKNDPGGISYGRYQLSSNAGTMKKFIDSPEAQPLREEFIGFIPGSKESVSKYKDIAGRKGDELQRAEHAYLLRTHYLPVADYAKKLGFDVNDRPMQEMLWSMAIQNGQGNSMKILNAVHRDGMRDSSQDRIRRMFSERTKLFPKERTRYWYEAPKVLEFDSAQQADKVRRLQADRMRRSQRWAASRPTGLPSGGGGIGGGW